MPLEYLPIMAQAGAPKPARVLVSPSKQAWSPITKPLNESKVALLSSAALRLHYQEAFLPREDLSFRRIPSDPATGAITIDHHSRIGRVPKQDPEIIFPRTALASLAQRGVIGALSPYHFSFMGGVRRSREIEDELAPAIAADLKQFAMDLALLVPY
jgi:D-proline reductase (dithiol) PrdB